MCEEKNAKVSDVSCCTLHHGMAGFLLYTCLRLQASTLDINALQHPEAGLGLPNKHMAELYKPSGQVL